MPAIANLASDCMIAFDRLLRLKQDRGDEATEVENDLFRFRLWAHNNAVLSQERDSMDYRLRRATVPHSVITDLLEELLQAVLHRMKADGDSASNVLTSLEKTDLLSQLLRFTRAIRRAGGPQRLMKAAEYVEWDENKFDGTKINLTAKFRERVKHYLDATLKLPNSPVGTDQLSSHEYLKERLLHTICIRQSTFALLKSRRKELKQDRPLQAISRHAATVSKASSQVSVRSTSSSQKKQKPQIPVNSVNLAPRPASVARSGSTLASNVQVNLELHTESTIETDVEPADLPRRPILAPGKRDQECPYCLELCSIAEFGDAKWPKHILQDLMPYVCILDNCPRPHAMYESRKAWTTHMSADHTVHGWTCMDGNHLRPELFENKQAFIEHISRHQNGTLSGEELAEAVEDCYGVLPSAFFDRHCPLCGSHVAGADGEESVEDHVAEHLLFLSQVGLEPLEGVNLESVLGRGSRNLSLSSQAAQSERSGLSSVSIANSTGLEAERDINTIRSIKTLIEEKCRFFVRPEISIALLSDDPAQAGRVDNALWRIWTFCKIFGSGKDREEDIMAQQDWLRGGLLVHQEGCTFSVMNTDYMNDIFVGAPECFAKGNEDGLSAEQLFDMMEMWNCLGVLLQGFEGRTALAREYGIYDNTDIGGGDIDGEEQMLDEWCYYLLTFGLSTVLELAIPCQQLTAKPFKVATENGWNNWKPPMFGGTRRNFLKEAASRVYEDKIARTYSTSSTHDIQRQVSKSHMQDHMVELRQRKANGATRMPMISMSQERPMSEWSTVIGNLTRPCPAPAADNDIVSHIPTLRSALAQDLGASIAEQSLPPNARSSSPPRRTVAVPLLPTPPPSTVPSTRDRRSVAMSMPAIEEHSNDASQPVHYGQT